MPKDVITLRIQKTVAHSQQAPSIGQLTGTSTAPLTSLCVLVLRCRWILGRSILMPCWASIHPQRSKLNFAKSQPAHRLRRISTQIPPVGLVTTNFCCLCILFQGRNSFNIGTDRISTQNKSTNYTIGLSTYAVNVTYTRILQYVSAFYPHMHYIYKDSFY